MIEHMQLHLHWQNLFINKQEDAFILLILQDLTKHNS